MSTIPTTCPDCKLTDQANQFCRFCQQHFGPNTNRPTEEYRPMTTTIRPQSTVNAPTVLDSKYISECRRDLQRVIRKDSRGAALSFTGWALVVHDGHPSIRVYYSCSRGVMDGKPGGSFMSMLI